MQGFKKNNFAFLPLKLATLISSNSDLFPIKLELQFRIPFVTSVQIQQLSWTVKYILSSKLNVSTVLFIKAT